MEVEEYTIVPTKYKKNPKTPKATASNPLTTHSILIQATVLKKSGDTDGLLLFIRLGGRNTSKLTRYPNRSPLLHF
jgi:hypothetical protein